MLFILPFFVYSQDSKTYKIKTVVIDAGHGGKDPGAVGKNAKEKDLTLALALKTGGYIEKYIPDVKVIYTRKTDVFVELHKRAEIANKNNADLFISIHVNASNNTSAYGTDSWVMGLHKNQANLEVAKLENKVISVEENYHTQYKGMSAESEQAIIIHTLTQSANLESSATLAALVQNQFKTRVGRKDRGVNSAPFLVLWKTTMPSILIESGFISNLEEEKFLMTENGQDLMSSAIYRAFKDYKQYIESKTIFGIDTIAIQQAEKEDELLKHLEDSLNKIKEESFSDKNTITYSIQIASSKNKINLEPNNFKGLENISFYKQNGLIKYISGKELTFEDIKKQLASVKTLYPEAFIIALKNGKRINLQEAKIQTN